MAALQAAALKPSLYPMLFGILLFIDPIWQVVFFQYCRNESAEDLLIVQAR